jgi:hypothetical protein
MTPITVARASGVGAGDGDGEGDADSEDGDADGGTDGVGSAVRDEGAHAVSPVSARARQAERASSRGVPRIR